MPLFLTHTEADYKYAIWHLNEPLSTLYRQLPNPEHNINEAEKRFKSEHRRYEFAAVRVLLHIMLQEEQNNASLSIDELSRICTNASGEDEQISYLPSGRPYLENQKYHISISHTHGYVAVILSRDYQVGIDVEQVRTKAYSLQSRFVRSDEVADSLTKILLHWSAKETAFKIIDQPDTSFLDHLYIAPFTLGLTSDEKLLNSGRLKCPVTTPNPIYSGTFSLQETKTVYQHLFEVRYRVYPYFVLTYTKVKTV